MTTTDIHMVMLTTTITATLIKISLRIHDGCRDNLCFQSGGRHACLSCPERFYSLSSP